jgi:hypothetical protein
MKGWMWGVFSVLLALVLACGALLSIAVYGPFGPEDGVLYRSQRNLEEFLVQLSGSPEMMASQRIRLAERRLQAVEILAGGYYESEALSELNLALNQAVRAASICSKADTGELQMELLGLFQHAGQVFRYLNLPAGSEKIDTPVSQAWIGIVLQRLRQPGLEMCGLASRLEITQAGEGVTATVVPSPTATPVWVNPHIVYFPPGSGGAKHQFYPLIGKHAEIDCLSCHSKGNYAGIKNQCEGCHRAKMPSQHYPGKCMLCHAPTGWIDTHYEHISPDSDDCSICHLKVMPAEHYPGQCSACHTTAAWIPATFDHAVAEATDCITCHTVHRPANHWNGQCSLCHSTAAWKPATFNHSAVGATDCQSCHARPSGHWGGQCSACHSTTAWKPATFNHSAAGATDCIACHSNRRPANHYDGQCSNCHSTNAWKPANFNHGFPMNHGGAGGKCATCHPSGGSSWTCFNCHNQSKMDEKHNEKGIPDYAGRCLDCHAGGEGDDD